MSRRGQDRSRLLVVAEAIHRAFAEFLALPTWIIAGFLVLSIGTYLLDRAQPAFLAPLRKLLHAHVFIDPSATSSLLSTVASGLITVTSITISLLLLALQQSAANLTNQILDQFVRRRVNQTYFGFFVGLSLYSLVTLTTVAKPFNPIFGASLAFLLTVVALYMLILLLYTTIDQMRPVQIMEAIHDHVLAARERQLGLIRRTRRTSICKRSVACRVKANGEGFVTKINADAIAKAIERIPDGREVAFEIEIGSYVAFEDLIATIKASQAGGLSALVAIVQAAVRLERQRDITADATYGIEELARIGWTSVSSAKSNLGPGLLALHALRDIMAHWSKEAREAETRPEQEPTLLPIVYKDSAFDQLLDAFESLAVASSESMQYQIFSEVLRTFTMMYPRLPSAYQPRAENLLINIMSVLGDHAPTRELDQALTDLDQMLTAHDRLETAEIVKQAQRELRQSVGKLNSRSSRVPQ